MQFNQLERGPISKRRGRGRKEPKLLHAITRPKSTRNRVEHWHQIVSRQKSRDVGVAVQVVNVLGRLDNLAAANNLATLLYPCPVRRRTLVLLPLYTRLERCFGTCATQRYRCSDIKLQCPSVVLRRCYLAKCPIATN